MAGAEHKHPNYMAIFWYLAILTAIEIAVIYAPLPKVTIVVLLCGLALGKAALVAMYFMHLRFETRTLGLVAITPLMIATLLVFLLRSEEHTSELQSQSNLVCRLLLEKKKKSMTMTYSAVMTHI